MKQGENEPCQILQPTRFFHRIRSPRQTPASQKRENTRTASKSSDTYRNTNRSDLGDPPPIRGAFDYRIVRVLKVCLPFPEHGFFPYIQSIMLRYTVSTAWALGGLHESNFKAHRRLKHTLAAQTVPLSNLVREPGPQQPRFFRCVLAWETIYIC